MKKTILLAFVVVSVLTSCRKVRVCECTYSYSGTTYTESNSTPYAMTKSNASTWCTAQNDTYTTCTLK